MKFFILINNDYDGVGQVAINLANNLKKLNHKVKVSSLHSKIKNNDIQIMERLLFLRIISFVLNLLKIKKIKDFKKNFLDIFWFGYYTIMFNTIKNDIEESDVIIIFTFHKIISKSIFEKIMKCKKIILLRPLDMELATGGCHFNADCQNFIQDCNKCPKLNFLNLFNVTKKNLTEKKRIVDRFKPKILAQNTYVKKIFQKSSIFNEAEIHIARLDVRKDRKFFYTKDDAREILNLNKKENIILFGAFDLSAHHKGGHLLTDALKLLETKYLKIGQKKDFLCDTRLLTIGKKNNFDFNSSVIKWSHLGLVNSDKNLNLLYRAADVLVCPSLQCFAPHIVSEAVENKLPVIAFDVGVAQDDIKHGENGFLVPCYDTSIFAKSIYQFLYNEKIREKILASSKKYNPERAEDEATTIINYTSKFI
jgi:glycosyltransferase involved in cell wall biosynthesis